MNADGEADCEVCKTVDETLKDLETMDALSGAKDLIRGAKDANNCSVVETFIS